MSLHSVSESIGRRFHRPPVASLVACSGLRQPIVFSHVASRSAMPAPTLAPPIEDAFALHVHHAPLRRGDMWLSGRHVPLPPVEDAGIFVFDLRGEPTAQLHEGFEFSRFHLPRAALDDLAYEQGLRRLGELRADRCRPDPVVKHLALAMLRRVELHGAEPDSVFRDALGLALFAHVAEIYGGARAPARRVTLLMPWQVRRIEDWAEAHLHEPVSIAALAALLDLSPSHFARAFTRTLGLPPHRWLLERRIALAQRLLQGSALSLAEVAAACGFADQSHFTRVFARCLRTTPGRWRQRGGGQSPA